MRRDGQKRTGVFIGTPQGCKRDLSRSSYNAVNCVEFGLFRMFYLAVFVTS